MQMSYFHMLVPACCVLFAPVLYHLSAIDKRYICRMSILDGESKLWTRYYEVSSLPSGFWCCYLTGHPDNLYELKFRLIMHILARPVTCNALHKVLVYPRQSLLQRIYHIPLQNS